MEINYLPDTPKTKQIRTQFGAFFLCQLARSRKIYFDNMPKNRATLAWTSGYDKRLAETAFGGYVKQSVFQVELCC